MKKELLNRNKNILKALHELYNLDFQEEITILKTTGKFTINSIKKLLGKDDLRDTNTVVIMADIKYRENYLYVVKATESGFCVSFPKRVYHYGIDDFWSKGGFEEKRKDENKTVYIISQRKELEKAASEKKVDMSCRFKYVRYIGWSDGRGRHGISQIDLIDTMHNGKQFTIKTRDAAASTDVNYFVDKSGYFVEDIKNELKRKALKLRREREKAAVDAISFDNEIIEIDRVAETVKKGAMDLMQSAANYEDICVVDNIVTRLRWVYMKIDRLKERNTNKSFSNVESAKSSFCDIKTELEKIACML